MRRPLVGAHQQDGEKDRSGGSPPFVQVVGVTPERRFVDETEVDVGVQRVVIGDDLVRRRESLDQASRVVDEYENAALAW